MERNSFLVQIFALLLLLVLGFSLYLVLTDDRAGLRIGAASLEDRVSYRYLTKTVSEVKGTPVVQWRGEGYENASANIVTSIVVDYRSFDTFGEILVLFAATAGVSLLLPARRKKTLTPASPVIKTAIPLVMIFAFVFGAYVILHGHLSPGGGFPGGAIIASAFLLSYLARGRTTGKKLPKLLETSAGLAIVAFALTGLFLKGSLFQHFLPGGEIGGFFSATGLMVLYLLIGVKVASELTSLLNDFAGE